VNLKTQLRAEIRSRNTSSTFRQKEDLVKNILNVLSGYEFEKIGFYYPIALEPDIKDILILLKNKTFALPKVISQKLVFFKYSLSDNLGTTKFGALAPLNNNIIIPDIILIPGIAFDSMGYRLGHGLGMYDKYLAHFSVIKIGVCFNSNLVNTLPRDDHDIKMDYVVTESLILKIC